MDGSRADAAAVRDRQNSHNVRIANYAKMRNFGAYNLVKVVNLSKSFDGTLEGYATFQAEISGKTPIEIEKALGLKVGDLHAGCRIFRFLILPKFDDFLVRGYSSLPDGLPVEHNAGALTYPPGQMAWQIVLTKPVPARLVATLKPGQRFIPGPHPNIRYT
ncbi:MAG: hypothetical protein GY873_23345 [Bosea sp.]|uniref:hypothetical protein n=1 Tax=Bosea sp. (in: a-proteobacteria) TaxID=1871050 RepID=UPI0023A628DB|nr:hypothetical protein [Bosea sp. (in: a-proteobacteria)]MCP4737130.1 hypothetical protein [Bosea sp. (in: a-proteobacteria)]